MGLDPIARKEFNRDLVEHLQTSGCTVLYSSHLLDEVEAVADAVAILDRGKIVRTGTTDRLRDEVKQILLPLGSVAGSSAAARACWTFGGTTIAGGHHRSGRQLHASSCQPGGIDHEVVDLEPGRDL